MSCGAPGPACLGVDLDIAFPLAAKAKALFLHALERALRSSKLNVRSENEAFTLMESWLPAQEYVTDEEEQEAWDRLSRSMRFHRMSCDFLNSEVARSYWFLHSSRKAHIFGTCLWHLEIPPTLKAYKDRVGPPDRGSANPRQWTFRAHFLGADLTKLEVNSGMVLGIGVANGYNVLFGVRRSEAGAKLYFRVVARNMEIHGSEYEDDDAGRTSGMLVAYAVRVEDLRFVRGWRVLSVDDRHTITAMEISSWEAFVARREPLLPRGQVPRQGHLEVLEGCAVAGTYRCPVV